MDRETKRRLTQLERRLNTVYNNALQTAIELEEKALERFLTVIPTDAEHARSLAFQRGRTAEMVSNITTEIANVNVIAGQMINGEALNAFTRGYNDTFTDIQGQVRRFEATQNQAGQPTRLAHGQTSGGVGMGHRVNWTMYNRQALNAIFNPDIFEGTEAFSQVGYRQQWQPNSGATAERFFRPQDEKSFPTNRRVWDSRIGQDRLKGQYYYNKAMGRLGDDTVIARRLRNALAEALILGEGMPSIATRLRAVTQSSRKQAMRIARTETLRALNQGAYLAAEQAANEHGIQLEKVWHSALDEFTRQGETADHVKANGVTAPWDKHFIISGEALMYPLDPNGSAANIINCRCSHSCRVVGINRTATQHDLIIAQQEQQNLDIVENARYNKRDREMRERIASGEQPLTIIETSQNRHMKGTSGYIAGRSFVYGTPSQLQGLVNRYAGTGEFERDGRAGMREKITVNHPVGVSINNLTGTETVTSSFKIHYSKRGTHIVPFVRGD